MNFINASNVDITNFEIIAKIDGINEIHEFPALYMPVGSSAKQYTFQSKVQIDPLNRPAFICVEAAQPNGIPNHEIRNNKLCKSMVKHFNILNIMPNPALDYCMIDLNLPEKGTFTLKIFDEQGHFVRDSEISGVAGFNAFRIETGSFSKGIYALLVEFKDEIVVRKFAKR